MLMGRVSFDEMSEANSGLISDVCHRCRRGILEGYGIFDSPDVNCLV